MRNKFDEQLSVLNNSMIEMGGMIVQSISRAIEALTCGDMELAKKIMEDDANVDRLQKRIESICFDLLIRQQPVARDLRTITAAMKMVTDMERIGDHAADISEMTIAMGGNRQIEKVGHIRSMAAETMLMLNHCVEAYVEKDRAKAEGVIAHDDVVDELFLCSKRDIIRLIREDRESGEEAADLLMAAKYFERIGDHATNIAEWVLFAIEHHGTVEA